MRPKLWVDDLREPPDRDWTWVKTSADAIRLMELCGNKALPHGERAYWGEISLDHDLGGEDTTRPVVMWMCEHDYWPMIVHVHTANPVGREWLEGMICRYRST
jgi:hypothetical protein